MRLLPPITSSNHPLARSLPYSPPLARSLVRPLPLARRPQANASSLIASGLWGLLYYKEITGRPAVVWACCAAFTAAMAVLLGLERA